MLLPVACPLLITAGHCAEFVYKESEDLTDLKAITPPSEQHHRLHLCYWFVSKKPHNRLRKLSKSTLCGFILQMHHFSFRPQSKVLIDRMLEHLARIELASSAWKADVITKLQQMLWLPVQESNLYHNMPAMGHLPLSLTGNLYKNGRGSKIRTCECRNQSPMP